MAARNILLTRDCVPKAECHEFSLTLLADHRLRPVGGELEPRQRQEKRRASQHADQVARAGSARQSDVLAQERRLGLRHHNVGDLRKWPGTVSEAVEYGRLQSTDRRESIVGSSVTTDLQGGTGLKPPSSMPRSFAKVMQLCLTHEPASRPMPIDVNGKLEVIVGKPKQRGRSQSNHSNRSHRSVDGE